MFKLSKVCKKKLLDTGKDLFSRKLLVFLSQNYKIQLIVIYGKSVDDRRLNDFGNAELIVSIRYTYKCFKN